MACIRQKELVLDKLCSTNTIIIIIQSRSDDNRHNGDLFCLFLAYWFTAMIYYYYHSVLLLLLLPAFLYVMKKNSVPLFILLCMFVVFLVLLLLLFSPEKMDHGSNDYYYHHHHSDEHGFVCSVLSSERVPGVKTRSESIVHFKQRPTPARTLIVLAYYLDPLGIDNLQFFLAQGLVPDSQYHFVLVINGPISFEWERRLTDIELVYLNFEWHAHLNVGYDFCVYKDALTVLELRVSIDQVEFFIFINKSLRGPFVPSYYEKPWPEIFTTRLSDTIKLSGTSINCGDDDGRDNNNNVTLHLQSMLWAFRSEMMAFVLDRLKCFNDKHQAIMGIEVGLPGALVADGFRLSSTMSMLSSKEGIPDANTDAICAWSKELQSGDKTFMGGDPYFTGSYAGIDLNPFEMVFFKSNRNVGPKVLYRHSIFALMNNNFTVPGHMICGGEQTL